jgi:hypothetical protein
VFVFAAGAKHSGLGQQRLIGVGIDEWSFVSRIDNLNFPALVYLPDIDLEPHFIGLLSLGCDAALAASLQ